MVGEGMTMRVQMMVRASDLTLPRAVMASGLPVPRAVMASTQAAGRGDVRRRPSADGRVGHA